ncbi:MAG TPA: arsenate reductase ArsC [bacterium]|jgi:arsenate reductase
MGVSKSIGFPEWSPADYDIIPHGMNNRKPRIIFICTGNSCRSQMAEGFMRKWAEGLIDIFSAGSKPDADVAPEAVQVMSELGIDISGARPKNMDIFAGENFDYVITVCDEAVDSCPNFHSADGKAIRLHMPFNDPYHASDDPEESIRIYREARDAIGGRIKQFLGDQFKIYPGD